ncbi:MAG: ABC transporter ATP-binding protein [Chloroflexi bacterium]|nr:ABC transporter ATP-binding protein [Chloroflexota bacterium]
MTSVSVRQLAKSFITQEGSSLQVLKDFSFCADDGDFVCLLGPSGCGKSTTLNILAGLVPKDAGDIALGTTPNGKARISYVFQEPRLLNWKKVEDNLGFVLTAMRVPAEEKARRIAHYLRLVDLQDYASYYPLALSGGMQQRVSIARALCVLPDLLLMDEPFSNLDEFTARDLRRKLLEIWELERKTVIFITHNALEAVFLANKIFLVSSKPATVFEQVGVDLPRPREFEDPNLLALQKKVITLLGVR